MYWTNENYGEGYLKKTWNDLLQCSETDMLGIVNMGYKVYNGIEMFPVLEAFGEIRKMFNSLAL